MTDLLHRVFVCLLIALSVPLQLVIMVFIMITSGWPVFFVQKRAGKNGKAFVMYKFRTMRVGADTEQQTLRTRNEAYGPVFKIHDDPRYTPIGKFLAHTGLDEIPQLYNVLRGDMTLFGPRPLPVAEAAKLKAWQKKRHAIPPGIISPWIFNGYHKQSFDAWMKSDIAYIKDKSFWYDLRLAGRTVKLLLSLLARELI